MLTVIDHEHVQGARERGRKRETEKRKREQEIVEDESGAEASREENPKSRINIGYKFNHQALSLQKRQMHTEAYGVALTTNA